MSKQGVDIIINGLPLRLPPMPPKTKMINYGKKPKDQKWEREELPDFMEDYDSFNPTKQQLDFVDREIDRILNGEWILINGSPIWITGLNYFWLTYWKLQEGVYPDYREIDVEFWHWWEICNRHPRCLGCVTGKYRRQGASSRGSCISVYIAITETNIHNGTISKTGDDAKAIFTDMMVKGFKALPDFMKPQSSGSDKAVKELLISTQAERMSKDKRIVGKSEGLNNKISWMSTALNSYDSRLLRFLFGDEFGKFPKDTPSYKYWQIAKRCLLKGTRRVGLAYVPSTVNSSELGGSEFRRIWENSNHLRPDFDGTTVTGLFKYMIPAYKGLVGYVGYFGENIIDDPTPEQIEFQEKNPDCPNPYIGAKKYHELEREKLKDDPEALSEYVRQFPFDQDEQFYGSATSSIINPLLANQQLSRINNTIVPRRKVEFYRDVRDGLVKHRDTDNGPWELIWDFQDFSHSNKYSMSYGKKTPTCKHLFSIGCDPFASSQGVAYGEGSKGVAWLKRSYVPTDQENSDMFIGRLNFRPVIKTDFHAQVFLGAEYFGCMAGYEDKFDDFVPYAIENGWENYMLKAPDNLVGKSAKIIKYGIPTNSAKAIEFHTNCIKQDFNANHHKYWWKELIEDYMGFDPLNRTKFDDSMAAGFSLITEVSCNNINVIPEVKEKKRPLLKRFSLYNGY